MAEVIQGRNVTLSIYFVDGYYPILCGTDCSFTRTPEFITKTGPGSGLFREFAVRIEEWSASVSGLTRLNNAATVSFFYMLQGAVRRVELPMMLTFEDDDAAVINITGNVLLGTMSINGPVRDFSQCEIEMKGTGPFEMDTIVPDPVELPCDTEDPIYMRLAEGATSVTNALLDQPGVVVLEVEREGMGLEETGSTPGNAQFRFDGTDTISFDAANPGNPAAPELERIYILYKIDG